MSIKAGLPTIIISISMFDSLSKIEAVEKQKSIAENEGYTLVSSESTRLVYQMIS